MSDTGSRFCVHCGKPLDGVQRFCPWCGEAVPAAEPGGGAAGPSGSGEGQTLGADASSVGLGSSAAKGLGSQPPSPPQAPASSESIDDRVHRLLALNNEGFRLLGSDDARAAELLVESARGGVPNALATLTWMALIEGEEAQGRDLVDECLAGVESLVDELLAARPEDPLNWRDQMLNVRSNAALCYLATGASPDEVSAVWREGAEAGHAESAAFLATLQLRQAQGDDAARVVARLTRAQRSEVRTEAQSTLNEMQRAGMQQAWFGRWMTDVLRAVDLKAPARASSASSPSSAPASAVTASRSSNGQRSGPAKRKRRWWPYVVAAAALLVLAVVVISGMGGQSASVTASGDEAPVVEASEVGSEAMGFDGPVLRATFAKDAAEPILQPLGATYSIAYCYPGTEPARPALKSRFQYEELQGKDWSPGGYSVIAARASSDCGANKTLITVKAQTPEFPADAEGWSKCRDARLLIPESKEGKRIPLRYCLQVNRDGGEVGAAPAPRQSRYSANARSSGSAGSFTSDRRTGSSDSSDREVLVLPEPSMAAEGAAPSERPVTGAGSGCPAWTVANGGNCVGRRTIVTPRGPRVMPLVVPRGSESPAAPDPAPSLPRWVTSEDSSTGGDSAETGLTGDSAGDAVSGGDGSGGSAGDSGSSSDSGVDLSDLLGQ